MSKQLRHGQITHDPRLDRVIYFDPRSKAYDVKTLTSSKTPVSKTWTLKTRLDQGQDGACVGFSWTHELAATPRVYKVDNAYAEGVYHDAQKNDEWAGENYSGSSVLGGAKALVTRGDMKEYRWAMSVDDIILAIGHLGPGVLGTNWYKDMFRPDSNGFVKPTGAFSGGHAIIIRGVNVSEKYVLLTNSWGASWGKGGDCKISFQDLDYLLQNQGEFCIPIGRKVQK